MSASSAAPQGTQVLPESSVQTRSAANIVEPIEPQSPVKTTEILVHPQAFVDLPRHVISTILPHDASSTDDTIELRERIQLRQNGILESSEDSMERSSPVFQSTTPKDTTAEGGTLEHATEENIAERRSIDHSIVHAIAPNPQPQPITHVASTGTAKEHVVFWRRRDFSSTCCALLGFIAAALYFFFQYRAAIQANELAAQAIELALKESCRSHPVSIGCLA
ncbi:hypothetical protein EG329_005055 [Mollisiaceae sp. DMI_Dod_QoI]|nr:hypothetical protein EG329_005055 [Helotiales sp. DMI_Dod_QoI]